VQQTRPDWSSPTQSFRLRCEIEHDRALLLETDHAETGRVFQKLIRDAEDQLERIAGRMT
jgi:hypothetical protein